jgi:ABC-type multidrug transport system fused ATPase/permease subunit
VAVMEAGKVVAVGHPSQLSIQDEWFSALAKASNEDTARLPLEHG